MSEETVFIEALDIDDPTERAAFLDRACAGDTTFRERLERLLVQHKNAGNFLCNPAVALRETLDFKSNCQETSTTLHPESIELVGTVIGAYKLLQIIGEGGMGTVFLAEQTEPVQRRVALKLIRAGMDTRQFLARFEAERQALALMDHPNIARVLDAGTTDRGLPYFVMELVEGVTITQYCDDNHLTCAERLQLFVAVCHAVQHAHQKGIIHRDIKPSNVMVCRYDGTPVPKVIDFGVAKATRPKLTKQPFFTEYGSIVGTLEYMSPEQAEINPLDVDTRSDVYALGVLMYELLTGTTPVQRRRFKEVSLLEALRLIREEEPPRPSTRLSTSEGLPSIAANRGLEPNRLGGIVRGELDWIAMKALEKDRSRRYETATGFAADVQRYLDDEPVHACPPTVRYRLRKILRRNRGPVLAAFLVMLALVGGLAGTAWGLIGAANARANAVTEETRKEVALRDAAAAQTEARLSKRIADERLLASLQDQARAVRTSRRPGQRFETLALLRRGTELARTLELPEDKFSELRDAAVAALALPDLSPTGPWHPWPAGSYGADFDSSYTYYARTDRKGNCSVRRMADDAEIHQLSGYGVPAISAISPDGKSLIVFHWHEGPLSNYLLELWDLGVTPARKTQSFDRASYIAYHPTLPRVALAYNDGSIGLFELPDGRMINRLPPNTLTQEVKLALHPTEPVVAICSYFKSEVLVRDLRTGDVIGRLPVVGQPGGIAWSPDGQTLAVGLLTVNRISLFDRSTLRLVRTLEENVLASALSFSPTGEHLVSTGWNGEREIFDVPTGRKVASTHTPGYGLRISNDGQRLAGVVQDGKLGVYQFAEGRECRVVLNKPVPEKSVIFRPAVSPDGRLAAAGISLVDGGIHLWDMASGAEVAHIPMPGVRNKVVIFERTGALRTRRLLTRGPTGVSRWPRIENPTDPDHLIFGPPEQLPLPPGGTLAQSDDGRVIVTSCRTVGDEEPFAGGWILHADRPEKPIHVAQGEDIGGITVSPDGRWVVTLAHTNGKIEVWDARDGRWEKTLGEWGGGSFACFSPDGRWLSTHLDGGRLYAVGTWEPGPQIGGVASFSRAGKLAAVPVGGLIHLIDPANGRRLVTLQGPDRMSMGYLVLTPEGDRLIDVYGTGFSMDICVWDLRLIRQQLAEMGLDWDAPPYPPATENRTARRLRVEFRTKPALALEERARRKIEKYRVTFQANQNDPAACNNLAWALLTAPEPLREVATAVSLAERAAIREPKNAVFANTLGAAYFRAGQYPKAAETFRPNLDRQVDKYLAFDLYFLAMAHHRLGEAARARDYFAWAGRWERTQSGLTEEEVEELMEFRAEASEVLGITAPVAPPPREKR